MTQTRAAAVDLGPAYTGLAIGYRILNLDETVYSAFSTTGVAETAVLGFYRKDNGVDAPDAGGYIVWGVSGTDYIEGTIPPAEITAAQVNTEVDTALADYDAPTKAELDTAVAPLATATDLTAVLADTNELQTDWVNGGRLDLILDARASQASVDTVDTVVDAILVDTGTDGVVVAAASKTGYALSSAGVQAIWEYTTRTLTSFGTLIADIWTHATRTITGGSLTVSPPTAAQIDSQLTGTHGSGTWTTATGFATPTNVTDAVAPLATTVQLGEVAEYIDTEIGTIITDLGVVDGVVDAILVDTTAIETAVNGLNNLDATAVQGAATAALNAYDPPTKGELDTAVSPLATQVSADAIKAVVDSILQDTGTDGVALASATIVALAEAVLKQGVASVEDTANEYSLGAVILGLFNSTLPEGGPWTILKVGGGTFVVRTIEEAEVYTAVVGVE